MNKSISSVKTKVEAPVAKRVDHNISTHGDVRYDPYFWLRDMDRKDEDVLAYLNAENDYTEKMMAHTNDLQQHLFDEIVKRLDPTDESVPVKDDGYFYYSRYEKDAEYPLHCRKKENLDNKEEIMLNVPVLAKGFDYYAIGGLSVSPSNEMIAYGEDTLSRRIYTIRFKNLSTGQLLEDVIPNTTGGCVWANDNKTVFYTVKDDALRPYKIMQHTLGTPYDQDKEIYHESDDTFRTSVYKTKSKAYVMIASHSTLSSEYRYLDADKPGDPFKIIQERKQDLEYFPSHYGDSFFIICNLDAKNFRLMKTPVNNTGMENWEEVIAHRDEVLLEGIEIFNDYLIVDERKNGLTQLRVIKWADKSEHYIAFNDPAYSAYIGANPDFNSKILRYGYSSLTTPNTIYDYNLESRERELKKRDKVIGGHNPDDYTSERLYAKARDGVNIPISLVYKKGLNKHGSNPTVLYGYGSYGASMDPYFSSVRLSMLDRGFIFAIAHIRGGQEMGRYWYEDGKLLKKKNTFYDFIDCAEYLIEQKYTNSSHLYAMGGSAGGLLMGAVINLKPELWKGIIAAVPFVDVVSTMLDETIPLTTGEFDEWGNPKEKEYYDYIKSYSPYDNVEAKAYPSLLVTTGLHDSQVQYWEPAKWVALLRHLKTDKNPLYLKTDMEAGHGGASGRFKRFKETALEYAFLLDLEGIKN